MNFATVVSFPRLRLQRYYKFPFPAKYFLNFFSSFFQTFSQPPVTHRFAKEKIFHFFMLQNMLFQHTPQLGDKSNSNFNRFLHSKGGVSCPFLSQTPKISHPYGKFQLPTRRIYSRTRPNSATRSQNFSIKKPQNNNQRPKNSSPHTKNHNHPSTKSRKFNKNGK